MANNETAPATSNRANRIFAFMGVLKNRNRMFVLSPCGRLPSNARATNLIGSNRQTLRVALTAQTGFAICRMLVGHASCLPRQQSRMCRGVFAADTRYQRPGPRNCYGRRVAIAAKWFETAAKARVSRQSVRYDCAGKTPDWGRVGLPARRDGERRPTIGFTGGRREPSLACPTLRTRRRE